MVTIPITGFFGIEVEAESKEEAIEEAWRKFHDGADPYEYLEWEPVSSVTTGNVCHAMQNDIEVSFEKSPTPKAGGA
jgi:hypothetical protein